MIGIGYVLLIMFIHWVSDFVFQTQEMATNKGKSIKWLSYHVFVYALLTAMGWAAISLVPIVLFKVFTLTFITHWCTDFVTSKITGYFYLKGDIHNFFVVVGIDQFIHLTTLMLTYNYLIN